MNVQGVSRTNFVRQAQRLMANVNLEDLLKRLLSEKLDFILIGGFASVVHGASYITQDLDICMVLSPENVERLRAALKDLHPVHRMNPAAKLPFSERPLPGEEVQNLYLQTDLGILDVITEVAVAGDFDSLKSRAFKTRIYESDCDVISIDDLIASKEAIGRKKDLMVVEELKAIRDRRNRK